MNNKIIGVIIGASIAVLMIGALLIPTINSAVDDEFKVVVNNTSSYYRAATDADYRVIADTDGIDFTVNGVSYEVAYGVASQIVTADNFIFRMSQDPSIRIQYFKDGTYTDVSNVTSIDIVVSNDSVTGSYVTADGTTNIDVPISWGFVVSDSETADYVYYNAFYEQTISINDVSQVYGSNNIETTGKFFSFNGNELYVNGVKNDTINFELTKVDGYEDYYTFPYSNTGDGLTFDVDNNGSPYTVRPYYIIVPKTILVTPDDNLSAINLLYAIPLITIVALIATIAYTFRSRY